MPACSGGVVCKWTNKDKEDHHLDKKRGPLDGGDGQVTGVQYSVVS